MKRACSDRVRAVLSIGVTDDCAECGEVKSAAVKIHYIVARATAQYVIGTTASDAEHIHAAAALQNFKACEVKSIRADEPIRAVEFPHRIRVVAEERVIRRGRSSECVNIIEVSDDILNRSGETIYVAERVEEEIASRAVGRRS